MDIQGNVAKKGNNPVPAPSNFMTGNRFSEIEMDQYSELSDDNESTIGTITRSGSIKEKSMFMKTILKF